MKPWLKAKSVTSNHGKLSALDTLAWNYINPDGSVG